MAPVSASSLDRIQLFQLPEQKTVLWDHTPSGRSYILHLSAHQNPKVYIKEKLLQWASSCLETEPNGRAFCIIYGSLSTIGGPSSVGISVNFNQCNDQDASKFLCGDEITVPVALSRKTKGDYQWDIEEYFADLKTIHTSCSSMVSLDLNQLLKMRITCSFYGIQCNVRIEMATIANSFTATPILPVSMLSTELSESLAKSKDFTLQTGFLTMDHEKQVVLIPEVEPQLSKIPLVGIWVSGASSVLHPIVWAACVRYISSVLYKTRLCLPPLPFLLIVYHPDTYKPTFYDCICDSGNTWPTFSCYEGHTFTDLPKVPVLDSKLLFVDLIKIDDRCKEFEEADKLIERNQMQTSPHVIMSNTEDAPQPSHKAPKNFEIVIDPEPQVPDLSFVSDGGHDYMRPPVRTTNLKTPLGTFYRPDTLHAPQHSPHNNLCHTQLQNCQNHLIGAMSCNNSGNKTNWIDGKRRVDHDCVMCYRDDSANTAELDRSKIVSTTQGNLVHESMNNSNFNRCLQGNVSSDLNNPHVPKQNASSRNEFESCGFDSQLEMQFHGNFHSANRSNEPFLNLGNHQNFFNESLPSNKIEELCNHPHFGNSFNYSQNSLRQVHKYSTCNEGDPQHFLYGREELPRQRPKPIQVPAYVLSSQDSFPTESSPSTNGHTDGTMEHLTEGTTEARMKALPIKSCLKKTSNLQTKLNEESDMNGCQTSTNALRSSTSKPSPSVRNSNGSAVQRTDKNHSMKLAKKNTNVSAKIPVRIKSNVPIKTKDAVTTQSNSGKINNTLVDIVKKQTEVLHTVQDKVLQLLQHQNLPSNDSNSKITRKSMGDTLQGSNQRKSPKLPNDTFAKAVSAKNSSTASKSLTKSNLQARSLQKTNLQGAESVIKTLQQQNEQFHALEKRINELMGNQSNVNVAVQQNQSNNANEKVVDTHYVDVSSEDLPSSPSKNPKQACSSLENPSNTTEAIEGSYRSEVVGHSGKHNLLSKRTSSIATMTSFVSVERVQKEVEKSCTHNYQHNDEYCSKNPTKHLNKHSCLKKDSKGMSSAHTPLHTEYKEHKNDIFIHKTASGNKLQSLKVNFGHDNCLSMSLRQKMQVRDHSPEPTIHVDMQDYPESTCSDTSDSVCNARNQHFSGNYHNRCATNSLSFNKQTEKTVYRNLLGNVSKILSSQPQEQSAFREEQACEERHPRVCENFTSHADGPPLHERREINRHHICRSGAEHISIVQQSCVITTKNCNYNFQQEDIDGKLNALAAQYLSDDDFSPRYNLNQNMKKKYPSARETGCSELTYYGMTSSSLSFATKRYLEDYALIGNIGPEVHGTENKVSCLDQIQESHSEPTEGGIWVFDKEHRCHGHPEFLPETIVKELA